MAGDPDLELVKTPLQRFFEIEEELIMLGTRRHIDEHAHELVLIRLRAFPPGANDGLTFSGNSSETSLKFSEGLSQ